MQPKLVCKADLGQVSSFCVRSPVGTGIPEISSSRLLVIQTFWRTILLLLNLLVYSISYYCFLDSNLSNASFLLLFLKCIFTFLPSLALLSCPVLHARTSPFASVFFSCLFHLTGSNKWFQILIYSHLICVTQFFLFQPPLFLPCLHLTIHVLWDIKHTKTVYQRPFQGAYIKRCVFLRRISF